MDRLRRMIGNERALRELAQALHFWAQQQGAGAVGAMHVTCADESERECVEAFQHGFVDYLLPALKLAHRAPFRIANLGGRHEWGAAVLAEEHYLAKAGQGPFTLLVAKVNSHVSFEEVPSGGDRPFRLGTWQRYGRESTCCGALTALREGVRRPVLDNLREAFTSEGKDRLAVIMDETKVEPIYRAMFAAMVSARLQARKIVLEVQDHVPASPTLWLVVPCVTVNRHERDTEILCGIYTIDGRGSGREVIYSGLGDDPGEYEVSIANRLFAITDGELGTERSGRDHRRMAGEVARSHGKIRVHGTPVERLERVREDVRRNKHRQHHHARALLRIALPILAEVAPIPVALFAFAQGAAGIHHVYRIHRLADEMQGTEDARHILGEIHDQIDQLDGEHAEALLELLVNEYSDDPAT